MFAREVALMAVVFVGYRQIRFLTRNDTDQALGNARRVLDIEQGWFVSERTVQSLALRSETVVGFLNRYYVGVHFPITILFVVWLLVRHPGWYRVMRNWLMGVTAAALAIHVAYPLAPPRMIDGFVDTLDVFGPDIYPADHTQSVANQFAAMPSLHFGWSVIVAAGFIVVVRNRWRWLALAHPVVTLVAIVATANHFWLDAAVAGVLVAAVATVTVAPAMRRSRRSRSEQAPAPAEHLDPADDDEGCEGDDLRAGVMGSRPDRGRPCTAHRARHQPEARPVPAGDRSVAPVFAPCHRHGHADEPTHWPGHLRATGSPSNPGQGVASASRREQSMLQHPSACSRSGGRVDEPDR
jgi:hypothetical protein